MTVISEHSEREEREVQPSVPDYPPRDPREEKDKAWHEWMGIAVALTALLSVLAIIVSMVALADSGRSAKTVTIASTAAAPAAPAAPVVQTQAFGMSIKADDEHGKLGPDGQWHDAFLPANITVHAGDKVTITFTNYDGGPHSFVSPSLGINQLINGGGSLTSPRTATVTFIAPKQPGTYAWWCGVPCDPWAMKHDGYMRGHVTVTA